MHVSIGDCKECVYRVQIQRRAIFERAVQLSDAYPSEKQADLRSAAKQRASKTIEWCEYVLQDAHEFKQRKSNCFGKPKHKKRNETLEPFRIFCVRISEHNECSKAPEHYFHFRDI